MINMILTLTQTIPSLSKKFSGSVTKNKKTKLKPFFDLINKATYGQKKEALRLQNLYGRDYAHRYLHIAVTRSAIQNYKNTNKNCNFEIWDQNELLNELPSYWEDLVNEYMKNKGVIILNNLFEYLFPQANEIFMPLENEKEIIPIIDPYDELRTKQFLQNKLIEWNWIPNKKQKVFFHPSLKYETIVLIGINLIEFDLKTFVKSLDFEINIELFKYIANVLEKAGFESIKYEKNNYIYRKPLFI